MVPKNFETDLIQELHRRKLFRWWVDNSDFGMKRGDADHFGGRMFYYSEGVTFYSTTARKTFDFNINKIIDYFWERYSWR